MNFVGIQLSHHIPTNGGDVLRIRTGYERVLAHRTSDSFSCAARYDGVVEEVNKKLKMIRVKYGNDEIDVFSYADLYTGSSGLVIEQKIELAVEQGQTVKRGDILVYNKQFFKPDPYSTQVDWKHGVMANVMIAEENATLQDSNCISKRLGEQFKIAPIEVVTVSMTNDTVVHDLLSLGAEVKRDDYLITYEDGELGDVLNLSIKDETTLSMIQQMNRSMAKSPVTGTIVKIDAYYGCPIAEMHPSLAAVVKGIESLKMAKHRFSKDTDAEYDNPVCGPLPKGEKYKNVDFTDRTVVLQFYIKEELSAGVGDKLVYDSSLKSVISEVIDKPMVTEGGVEVDAVFSGSGINRRTITSPLIVGTVQRVLEKTEQNIIDWWDRAKIVLK